METWNDDEETGNEGVVTVAEHQGEVAADQARDVPAL